MKLHRILALVLTLQLYAVLSAFGQGSYKAEAIGAAPADVPAAIQGTLDSAGVRVTSDQGAVLCEVWLRKTLPTSPNPSSSSDVLYGTLPVGAFVGVLHFPNAATDFRSQNIKAGFYTLRYGQIPQDGNHMGVNPTRDAFVLAPIAADTNPNKVLSLEDLVKLSAQASGTPHPGFLVGAAVSGSSFPSIGKDDSGNTDVQLKGHQGSGDLPLAITVVGHWQG
ncbi:MAG: hypothetical protein ACLQVL_16270 [Terriglobia bacterium]